MSKKIFFATWMVVFLVGTVFASSYVFAQSFQTRSSGISSSSYNPRPSFQTYYSQAQMNTYWPILGESADECMAREDLLLGVPPGGCEPMVVRSDLLAEQDVPVFCQLDAVKINPLIDVSRIRNIVFRGDRPEAVSDFGFHPARAAVGSSDVLSGSPLINNVGYVVVVLKRQPVESELPDFVNLTLSAEVDYISGNAYGVGRSEFILESVSDADWEKEKLKQSFWGGKYFVRLLEGNEDYANVAIYYGDRRISSTRVNFGETSNEIFVPGLYCQAGLQIRYSDFVGAEEKARIEVSSGNGVEGFDVYEGTRFLDDRCTVKRIDINEVDGETGKVVAVCNGKEFELLLKSRGSWDVGGKETEIGNIDARVEDEDYLFVVRNETNSTSRYRLDSEDNLFGYLEDGREVRLLSEDGVYDSSVSDEQSVRKVRDILVNYKNEIFAGGTDRVQNQGDVYFDSAIDSYELVVDRYSTEEGGIYGRRALDSAIDLAGAYGNDVVKSRLMRTYLDIYDGDGTSGYASQLNLLDEIDFSNASEMIRFSDKPRVVSLVSLSKPKNVATAQLNIEGRSVVIEQDRSYAFTIEGAKLDGEIDDLLKEDTNGKIVGQIRLDEVGVDDASVSAYCVENSDSGRLISTTRKRFNLKEDAEEATSICGALVKLEDVKTERVSKIQILPSVRGTSTETNFTVGIGIEKRAIELTPDKVRSKIDNLNETIEKWSSLSEKLGKVVSGLKTACFATAGLLTFKNFFSGLSGTTIARQDVMNGAGGWKERCGELMPGSSLDACYATYADDIDAEVSARTSALSDVNSVISGIQNDPSCVESTELFGKSVNNDCVNRKIAEKIRNEFSGTMIAPRDNQWQGVEGEVSVETLLAEENVNQMSSDQLRTLYTNLKEAQAGVSLDRLSESNGMIVDQVDNNLVLQKALEDANLEKAKGLGAAFYGDGAMKAVDVVQVGNSVRTNYPVLGDEDVTHTATYVNDGKKYILGLEEQDPIKKYYTVKSAMVEGGSRVEGELLENLTRSVGTLRSVSMVSYNNEMLESDNVVKYYENEPYRGMPALVPIDSESGWYAATKQTIPAFGGIGAFDASGRVTSFWLCNVGENGRIEFNSGYGDDACQMINTNTGQPIGSFPGLSTGEAERMVSRATQCIQQAADQYGNKAVNVCGATRQVGSPVAGSSDAQCQDFMSPKDCLLLFNVCDPVICPPSRCNLGGTFHVADVVQTGIIGSVMLCLPNFKEKIVMPVCLTGIHAGIDGLVSIMKNYRDCLVENLETGEMTGICDQIYSIYLCEFFWNQVAPFVNVLIPKIVELAYGQGVRGGAEYLSVMSAWQNMESSVEYFTQSYAVNSMNAFAAKNVQEVGTQFCEGFVSVASPTSFETLVEPDSPPQFHAWFSEREFTSATVPATSQYKVFYHIYAGNDRGVTYNVYLKSPPDSSYYQNTPTIGVESGFISPGDYASETVDFTAPEGYRELCVRINNEEHCDFKQVSSSFAVNYLRDEYVQSELENSNIQSEAECISGSVNAGALLTPNVQAGVEETINPAIYDRGVVRICSTANPGMGTDPGRFVKVGICDSQQVGCWLDKTSVDRALTDGNFGARNETLETLGEISGDYLNNEQGYLTRDEAESEIQGIEKELTRLRNAVNSGDEIDFVVAGKDLIESINLYEETVFFNSQKAHLLVLKGDVYKLLALVELGVKDAEEQVAGIERGDVVDETPEEGVVDYSVRYYLSAIGSDGRAFIVDANNDLTGFYVVEGESDLFESSSGEVVGYVDSEGVIVMDENSKSLLTESLWGLMDGNVVEDWKIFAGASEVEGEDNNFSSDVSVDEVIEASSSKCEAVCDGVFNACNQEECNAAGDCYFVSGFWADSCYDCTSEDDDPQCVREEVVKNYYSLGPEYDFDSGKRKNILIGGGTFDFNIDVGNYNIYYVGRSEPVLVGTAVPGKKINIVSARLDESVGTRKVIAYLSGRDSNSLLNCDLENPSNCIEYDLDLVESYWDTNFS